MILGDIFLEFSVDSQDAKGRTLLMNISLSGKIQAVQGLMKRGADLCLMNKKTKKTGYKNVFCFSAQSTDTDINNLILLDVPDIDPRNTEQGPLPFMVAGFTGKGVVRDMQ